MVSRKNNKSATALVFLECPNDKLAIKMVGKRSAVTLLLYVPDELCWGSYSLNVPSHVTSKNNSWLQFLREQLCHARIGRTGFANLTYIHSLNNLKHAPVVKVQNQLKTFSEGILCLCFCCLPDLGFERLCVLPVAMWSCLGSALGGVPSPFDCYLCNRGLKTLHLRMERHFKNAMAAAKFLEADPRVERVIFPGGGIIIIVSTHNSNILLSHACCHSTGWLWNTEAPDLTFFNSMVSLKVI